MTYPQRSKEWLLHAVSILSVLLFAYSGLIKLMKLATFQEELSMSPLIPSAMVPYVSVFLPLLELIICVLFFTQKHVKTAFYLTYSLMLFFTLYIIFLLTYSSYIPCSCGGILGNMSWGIHIAFNFLFVLLNAAAIWLLEKRLTNK